jgi:hypothetical protein
MEMAKWNYFQFRRNFNYPVYVRFKEVDLSSKFSHVLTEMGFSLLSELEAKKIQLNQGTTKILTIQPAGPRLQQQINGSDLLDRYGLESLSLQAGMPVYTYRRVGIMGLPYGRPLWDLAMNPDISHTDQMIGFRIILVRFLAQTLADHVVICYWGTVKDDTVVMMKLAQSFGEAILIDVNKKIIFSNGGELKIGSTLKIVRKDKETRTATKMSREDLIGFLSVSTCLLSFSGVTPSMKKAIYDLSVYAIGFYALSENGANL